MVCDLVVREEVGVLVCCIVDDVLLLAHLNAVEDELELEREPELE